MCVCNNDNGRQELNAKTNIQIEIPQKAQHHYNQLTTLMLSKPIQTKKKSLSEMNHWIGEDRQRWEKEKEKKKQREGDQKKNKSE